MDPLVALTLLALSSPTRPSEPVTIDGQLEDAFWRRAARQWTVLDPAISENRARFYLGWDERYLYFAADVDDTNVVGTHRDRKDRIWLDDAVELFIDFGSGRANERTPQTFEYGFSAAGGVNWTRGKGDGSGRNFPAHDWPPQWQSRVEFKTQLKPATTLNEPADRDAGYVVEARIPWSEFGQEYEAIGKSATRPAEDHDAGAPATIGINFLNIVRPEQRPPDEKPLSLVPAVDFSNNHNPSLWKHVTLTMRPSLALRGLDETFPFWLGTTLYQSHWKMHESNERNFDGWWFNKERWRRRFAAMERQRVNAICFNHPHPYPGLLSLERYPTARHYRPDVLGRHQEMFRWITAEAKRHGVNVYFLTWNICLPPSFARKHGLKEFGSDTPLARAYTRYCVTELFRTYPELGGLVTMAAEAPPGCVDFVADAIIGGLKDSGTNPDLIFWTWCSWPQDAKRILAAYPKTRLMHYLQYEQFFKPMADPRIGLYSAECDNAPMIAVGGPKSAHGYLLWFDPQYARQVIADLTRGNGAGIFVEAWCMEPSLAREAFARYAFDLGLDYDATIWYRWLAERYDIDLTAGRSLLEAMHHASAIIPRFLVLVHSQSDHYMPQFGLPLIYYLEMPTLNTYVFENTQTVNEAGHLTPRLGLSHPNPDWGERVLGVKEYVASPRPPSGATTPPSLARELASHAAQCNHRIDSITSNLRAGRGDHAGLPRLLKMLRLNAALGSHFASKIEAAVAWQRFKSGKTDGKACIRHLGDSLEAWKQVVRVANRVFPKAQLPGWKSELASQPPWQQNAIWRSYRRAHLHWRDHLMPFQREFDIVREQIRRDPRDAHLPLWEQLMGAWLEQVESIATYDFEHAAQSDWQWHACARRTTEPTEVITGRASARLDTRPSQQEWNTVLTSAPGAVRLQPGQKYQVQFEYRILDAGSQYPEPFAMAARTPTGGGGKDIGQRRFWGGPTGAIGTRVIQFEPRDYDDYYLFFCIRGRAAIVVDNVRIERIRPQPAAPAVSQPSKPPP